MTFGYDSKPVDLLGRLPPVRSARTLPAVHWPAAETAIAEQAGSGLAVVAKDLGSRLVRRHSTVPWEHEERVLALDRGSGMGAKRPGASWRRGRTAGSHLVATFLATRDPKTAAKVCSSDLPIRL